MPHCPICSSSQIMIVLSTRPRAWCDRCGARWTQDGSEQIRVLRSRASSPSLGVG